LIENILQKSNFVLKPTYEDYVASDAEARDLAKAFLKSKN